jgi:multimeric flavodoxin WrbA
MVTGHPYRAGRNFLFLLGSARDGGNTEILARYAARGVPRDAGQRWLRLSALPLPEYSDTRHQAGRSDIRGWPADNELLLLEGTLHATDLVIVSPLYWYSVSASVKRYLDYWVWWMYTPEAQFKAKMRGKTMWVITVLSEDPEQASPMVDTLRRCAIYLGMRWGGVLLGNGSAPGQVTGDADALAQAVTFFAAPGRDPASVRLPSQEGITAKSASACEIATEKERSVVPQRPSLTESAPQRSVEI